MAILMMLILPIHEHGTCFHFFVSSLISFFSVVYFLRTGLLPPWLGLFLGTSFLLLLYQMAFFFLISVSAVPLVSVPVVMPVPGCFDDSGLVIQFDSRYCDPSCFVLLSQNCCSYSGSYMAPYEFLKCLFYICEICHG